MYSEKLEKLINIALADGVLTEKEKQILFKNAEAEGIDLDEFEMVLDARLYEKQQGSKEEDKFAIDKTIVLGNDFILKFNGLYYDKLLKRIEQSNDAHKPHDVVNALDANVLESEYTTAIHNCFDYLLESTKSVLSSEHIDYIKKRCSSFLSDDSKILFALLPKFHNSAEKVISEVSNSTLGSFMKGVTTGFTAGSVIPGLGNVTGAIVGGVAAWINGDKEEKILEAWDTIRNQVFEQYDALWEKLCETLDEIAEKTPINFEIDDDVFEKQEKNQQTKGFTNPIETIIRENLTVHDRLYFHENLPKEKLSNAMNSYIFLDDDEQIICLYDSTLFGSASDGVCFSTKGIYWKGLWEDSDYLCYCDIETIKKGKDCLYINGIELPLLNLSNKNKKEYYSFFTTVSKYAKETFQYSDTLNKWVRIVLKKGELTEKRKIELYKRAKSLGYNFDKFESDVDEIISDLSLKTDLDTTKRGGILSKVSGRQAYLDYKEAKQLKADSEAKYKEYSEKTVEIQRNLNHSIEEYGRRKLETLKRTLGVFLTYLQRMEQKYKENYYELMDGCDLPKAYVAELGQLNMNNSELLKTAVTTGGFAYAAVAGVPTAVSATVGALATASTGTAISTLSGAASTNAILAWLGGGSIAAGGGGMAAGAVVLAGITYTVTGVVALAATGIMASSIMAKKLTQAQAYSSEIDIACEKMETSWVVMDGIKRRVYELIDVTTNVYDKCIIQLAQLEPIVSNFDTKSKEHVLIFQKAALLVKSMSELAKTPLFGDDMNLSEQSEAIITKTRKILNTEL
jgi:hypothetical protein